MLESCRTSSHWASIRQLLLKCRLSPSCFTYVLFIPIIQCVCLSLIPIVPHVCLSCLHHATCTHMSCLFPLCYMCAFLIPIMTRVCLGCSFDAALCIHYSHYVACYYWLFPSCFMCAFNYSHQDMYMSCLFLSYYMYAGTTATLVCV